MRSYIEGPYSCGVVQTARYTTVKVSPLLAVVTLGVAVQLRVVGVVANVNPFVEVTDPEGLVTTTFTAPAECAGVVTTNCVEVFVEIVAADPSKVTPVTVDRFVPEIVTEVPPAVDPALGEIEEIVGVGLFEVTAAAEAFEVAELLPAIFVTVTVTLMYLLASLEVKT
jgi:hypothetical protein